MRAKLHRVVTGEEKVRRPKWNAGKFPPPPRGRERTKKKTKSPNKHAIYPGRPFRLFSPPPSLSFSLPPRNVEREIEGGGKSSSGIESCRPCYACENRVPRFAARQGGYRVAAHVTEIFYSSFLAPCQLCPDIFVSFPPQNQNKNRPFSLSFPAAAAVSRWKASGLSEVRVSPTFFWRDEKIIY